MNTFFRIKENDNLINGINAKHKKLPFEILKIAPILKKDFYSNHHPIIINNEGLPKTAGYQTVLSAGIYFKKKHFEFQSRPNFSFSENKYFETFYTNHADITWRDYYQWINRIDNPEYLGSSPIKKASISNTSLSYNHNSTKIEISNKNIWWGPGIKNALIMTNNAEGFSNINLSSSKPIKTEIGDLEFQFVTGLLKNSDVPPNEPNRVYQGEFLYRPKLNSKRIFTGGLVSFQPKKLQGLHLGYTKAAYSYYKYSKSPLDYLPLFGSLGNRVTYSETNDYKKMMGSVFARYLMKNDNAEIYAEYGNNNRVINPLLFLSKNKSPSGYIIGVKKAIIIGSNKFVDIGFEYTDLSLKDIYHIKNIQSWYIDDKIRHGYTHKGKIIGSGIGPGGESQFLQIGFNKGINRIGIELERRVYNNDFYYFTFERVRDFRRHWVDLISNIEFDIQLKNMLIGGKLSATRTLNYQWFYQEYEPITDGNSYYKNGLDYFTLEGNFYIYYLLNFKK